MDQGSIDTILEYLQEMAAQLSSYEADKLQNMKANLDEYVNSITSKIPAELRITANKEFEKWQKSKAWPQAARPYLRLTPIEQAKTAYGISETNKTSSSQVRQALLIKKQ